MGIKIVPKSKSKPKSKPKQMCFDVKQEIDSAVAFASGGMIVASDMSAKKMASPAKKKKIPQYYMGGGKVKKNYAYGGRVAKYKG